MPTAEGDPANQLLRLLGGVGMGGVGLVFAAIGLVTIITGWSELALVAREQLTAGQTAPARADVGRMPTSPGSALSLAFNADVMMRAADYGGDVINFTIIGATVAIVFGQPVVGVGLVLLPTVGLLLGLSLKGVVARSFTRRIQAQSGVGRSISNTVGNALTFKLFAAEEHATAHISAADSKRVSAANAENIWRALGDTLSYVPSNVVAVAVFWFVVNGSIPIEQGLGLYTAVTMTEYGVTAAKQFVLEFASLRGFASTYQRLVGGERNFAHAHPAGHAPFAALRPPASSSDPLETLESIETKELTVTLRSGNKVLDGVDMAVTAGQLVVVCGAIGSGKTTLLRVLAGLIPAQPDQILWNGQRVDDTSLLMRPPTCSYAPQIPMMLSGSLQENISLDRDVDVAGAITAAALDADLARLDGPNTVIGHKGVKLSGGQIQRAAVARALAQSSQLLLLDDVSSALDAPTEREIWTSLRASGRTVVASTYKRFVAEMADQIIVLDHGRVVASGSWTQVSATHQHLFA
jgi:ABC-type multidrug transport system fused ATPase/permease subunit